MTKYTKHREMEDFEVLKIALRYIVKKGRNI